MSDISEWSTIEENNTHLDELTLSGEGALYINKLMCAIKAKEDEQDAKLDAVAGGLVFRGTKATYADLEAVTSPAVGDMYSVTALGGENYAWTGESWDSLGTSDANVVHKTGNETIAGEKTFADSVFIRKNDPFLYFQHPEADADETPSQSKRAGIGFYDGGETLSEGGAIGRLVFTQSSSGGTHAIIALFSSNSDHEATEFGVFNYNSTNSKSVSMSSNADNLFYLGGPSSRWKTIYAGTGTINTSDLRSKRNVESFSDKLLDAWEHVDFVQFKFQDAINEKGEEKARTHVGLVAQQINDALANHGVKASDYGFFCYDDFSTINQEHDDDTGNKKGVVSDGDAYGLRYEEALCLEAACQRRRADRAESRIVTLEQRIAALEERLNGHD